MRNIQRKLAAVFSLLFLTIPPLAASEATLRVVATTTDLASLVKEIGGERIAEAHSLTRPLEDPHYLNATPGMVVRTSRADLFVMNGMDLEVGWIPAVLRQTRNHAVRPGGPGFVDASSGVRAIQVPDASPGELRALGDVHPQGNPHFTLEPVRAITAARNIAEGLRRVDPDFEEVYRNNLTRYEERAREVLHRYRQRFDRLERFSVIVYHQHFDYLFEALGVTVADAIEPRPGIEPSARHIGRLIATYRDNRVDLVIMEPWHNRRVARQVADGIGVPLVVLCPAVNACEGTGSVIELFQTNAERLLQHVEDRE